MTFLLTFIVLSIINVVFSTIRTITTVKSGKTIASIISGGYFAFYNVMLIYTVADFPLWEKCVITFICNVLGVWCVKFFEERMKKDKLWKIEFTVKPEYKEQLQTALESLDIPHNYVDVQKYCLFNIYSSTQEQSEMIKLMADEMNAKYFVAESKSL